MTCKPTTFAQIYAEGSIKAGTLNAEAGLLDFSELILRQNNPTEGIYITIPVLLQFSLIPMNLESYKYLNV